MANEKGCYVCGKLYDNNKFDHNRIQGIKIMKNIYDGGLMVYDLCDMVYDLCDSCYHKLLKFMHEDGDSDGAD